MKHTILMEQPASDWKDAIPLGNGIKGAMIYGGVFKEKILLNHKNLWLERETLSLPDLEGALAEVRALIESGKYREADRFLGRRLLEKHYDPDFSSYLPGFDIVLNTFPVETGESVDPEEYSRVLDAENGEARVRWKSETIEMERRTIVSISDDLIVSSIGFTPGAFKCIEIDITPHYNADLDDGDAEKENIIIEQFGFEKYIDGSTIQIEGVNTNGSRFGAGLKIFTNGTVELTEENKLAVSGGSEILLLCDIYVESETENSEVSIKKINNVNTDKDVLFEEHRQKYSSLFNRMKLQLDPDVSSGGSVESLIENSGEKEHLLNLIQKMFDFGRHLLIASSSAGDVPANLQGIWNGDYDPVWYSFIMANENVQMNYWQALPGNLLQTLEPFFRYFEDRVRDYEENAGRIFGCRGIYVPADSSPESGLLKDVQGHIINWTAGAGWIASVFYDYYLFSGDKDFLVNRAIPFMKKAAEFYEDFLIKNREGVYQFVPSVSPENAPERFNPDHCLNAESNISVNATMDIAVCRELFTNLIDASIQTGVFAEKISVWEEILKDLPGYRINSDGALSEWVHPDFPDNYYHRHISHLYPLFPGLEIGKGNLFFDSCRTALDKRLEKGLDQQTSWSLVHLSCAYARAGEGDRALGCLKHIAEEYTGNNLFTYIEKLNHESTELQSCPGEFVLDRVFQVDANLGFPAAVLEMIVSSRPGEIDLLRNLPSLLNRGEAEGLLCRGGVTLDVKWSPEKIRMALNSKKTQTVNLHVPPGYTFMNIITDEDSENGNIVLKLVAGQSLVVEIDYPEPRIAI